MPKILVIEDVLDNAEFARRVLTSRGYEICHAPDAETGLQMAMDEHPDLILLDLGLPDADGQTLAGWLRNIPDLDRTPIVVFTAWPEETAREMVRAYGCDGYIHKPVSMARLSEQIAKFLQAKLD